MRPQIGEVDEPRTPAVTVHEIHDALRQERGLRVLGAVLRTPAGSFGGVVDELAPVLWDVVAGGLQPFEPELGIAFGEMADRVHAGENAFVAPQTGIVGGHRPGVDPDVGVAEQCRFVAERPSLAGDVAEPVVERGTVDRLPVVEHVHAGVEAGPAGPARRRVGEVTAERDPARGQPIEVGRAHDRVPGGRQAVAAELVGGHEQDVELGVHVKPDPGNRK